MNNSMKDKALGNILTSPNKHRRALIRDISKDSTAKRYTNDRKEQAFSPI
jgi:hypothetical protein